MIRVLLYRPSNLVPTTLRRWRYSALNSPASFGTSSNYFGERKKRKGNGRGRKDDEARVSAGERDKTNERNSKKKKKRRTRERKRSKDSCYWWLLRFVGRINDSNRTRSIVFCKRRKIGRRFFRPPWTRAIALVEKRTRRIGNRFI